MGTREPHLDAKTDRLPQTSTVKQPARHLRNTRRTWHKRSKSSHQPWLQLWYGGVVVVVVCLIVAANTIADLLMAMGSTQEAIGTLHVRVHASTRCKEFCRRWRQKPTSTSSLRFTTSNNIQGGNRCPQAAATSCTIVSRKKQRTNSRQSHIVHGVYQMVQDFELSSRYNNRVHTSEEILISY